MGIIMISKVFFHIGLHKTGSSSIQQSLKSYDDGSTFYADLGPANHSEPLISIFSSKSLQYRNFINQGLNRKQIESFKKISLKKLNTEINKDRNQMILSGEDLSDLVEEDIKELINFFDEKKIKLIFIAYIRNPKDWRKSTFQQKIKGGECYVKNAFSKNFRLLGRLQKFRLVLGSNDFVIRDFSKSKLKNGCVVSDFCNEINIDPPKQIINANESLSLPAIKLLFLFNNSSTISSGNKEILIARYKLIDFLKDSYRECKSIDSRYFSTEKDSISIKRAFKEFKIGFDASEHDPKFNLTALKKQIINLEDVNLDPLDIWLKKQKFNPDNFKSPESKLLAIFYKLMMNTYYFRKIAKKV